MIQTLYGLLAMMMVALLTLTMNNAIHSNGSRMMMNEVSSQVTPIADEIFEQIGQYPYDSATLSGQFITDPASMLADADAFGSASCDPNNRYEGCEKMHDLHGTTALREVDGMPFEIDIEFEYVNDSDPTQASSIPTFSKKVTLTITSPYIYVGSSADPLQIALTRVYSYPRILG